MEVRLEVLACVGGCGPGSPGSGLAHQFDRFPKQTQYTLASGYERSLPEAWLKKFSYDRHVSQCRYTT
jgi:hypothetical protein